MAAPIPTSLKSADIQRFATRAAQLEKFRPIATYWLEYHILQTVLSQSLHTSSPEAGEYAERLMNKLEKTKETYATEAAVVDDDAAKAYMERFATETFNRAEEAQNADKVTRQTADTFQAAATFFDSLDNFENVDPESRVKSKFAKFHAIRIARALKEGKDPNETNPKIEVPAPVAIEEEDIEAELQKYAKEQPDSASALQPSVEDIPETAPPCISPVDAGTTERSASIGGGYFPNVPSALDDQRLGQELSAPHVDQDMHISQQDIDMLSPSIDTDTHIPTAVSEEPEEFYGTTPIQAPIHIPAPVPAPSPTVPVVASVPPPTSTSGFRTDDDAVMAAQKHAKWAISALNFEDVPTAVKELRIALQSLGGL